MRSSVSPIFTMQAAQQFAHSAWSSVQHMTEPPLLSTNGSIAHDKMHATLRHSLTVNLMEVFQRRLALDCIIKVVLQFTAEQQTESQLRQIDSNNGK